MENEVWWIDCDAGVDDAAAIILAIAEGKQIVGISSVFGNTSIDNVNKNVAKVLEICKTKINIYPGCKGPLTATYTPPSDGYFGKDGLGDAEKYFHVKGYTECIQKQRAALAIIEASKQYEGKAKFNIVALGPVTNLALASKLDTSLRKRIHRIYTMGGTVTGHGIMNMCTDYNWHLDPEAAHIFLNNFDNIVVVPMEGCWPGRMNLEESHKYRNSPTEVGKFFKEISRQIVLDKNDENGFTDAVYDAVTMIAALDESLITKEVEAQVTIDLVGENTKGAFAIDWDDKNSCHDQFFGIDKSEKVNKKKHRIVLDMDSEKVKARIIDSVYKLK